MTGTPVAPAGADIPGVTRRHRFADLYHERTNFQFIARSRRWAILSAVMLIVSVVAVVVRGLDFSIEFEGGTVWQVELADDRDAAVPEVRDLLEPLGFGEAKVSTLSAQGTESVRVQAETVTDPVRVIQEALADAAAVDDSDVVFTREGEAATFRFVLPEGSEVDAADVERALDVPDLPAAEVELADRTVTVTVAAMPSSPIQQVADALAEYAGAEVEAVTISTVGPTWGETISRKALQALVIFFLLLAVYLSLRFEWKMAVSAIAAVLHDIVIVTGFYALFQFTVSPATVTAFLTILGFSLYDTVVVFDKIGENERTLVATGRSTYPEMVNESLNNVLMRSLSTTLVALLPVLSLLVVGSLVMGATVLEEFALALAAGLFIGSYSSLFVAAPLLAWWKGREPQYRVLADKRRRTTLAASSAATGAPAVEVAPSADPAPEPRPASAVTPRPRTGRGSKRRERR